MINVCDRFLKYLEFNTEAINYGREIPSSIGQIEFANYLVDELIKIGIDKVEYSEGVVYGYKKGAYSKNNKSIGLVAHLDTYPLKWGKGVEPFVIDDYCGEEDLLPINKTYPSAIVDLLNDNFKHHKLIFSKKKTLLGGDDKAGVAEIVTALEYIMKHDIQTNDIYVAFVCDEEIGKGSALVNYDKFKADYIFVLDGEFAGEIHMSNMSSFFCGIKVRGEHSFLGRAKNVMKNAIDIIVEFMGYFSNDERPQFSEGDDGFFHFSTIQGDSLNSILMCTIMDFEEDRMNEKIQRLYNVCNLINTKYGERTISIVFPQNRFNHFSKNKSENIVKVVEKSMLVNGLKCQKINFRGLTDATLFREQGKEAITIGIGCSAFHSIYEWASINDMEKTVRTLVSISKERI